MAAKYSALCQNLKLFLVDGRLETKTGLVILILLNTRDLSKIITLKCNS